MEQRLKRTSLPPTTIGTSTAPLLFIPLTTDRRPWRWAEPLAKWCFTPWLAAVSCGQIRHWLVPTHIWLIQDFWYLESCQDRGAGDSSSKTSW